MTQLETLLERAADERPLPFDAAAIGRRVQRRRRARRSVLGLAVVLVAAAGVVAAQQRDGSEATVASDAELDVVGRWTGLEVDGMTAEERLDQLLDDLSADIAAQQELVDWAEGVEKERQSNVLQQLLQRRADLQTAGWGRGAFLELRPDGTLGGDDGCGAVAGHWRLDDDRLLVDGLTGSVDCTPPTLDAVRTPLQLVLDEGPTVSAADGALTLTSPAHTIRFLERDATVETELQVPLDGGGIVKVTFRIPRSLAAGDDQVLGTWTAVTSADGEVTVAVRIARNGSGGACRIDTDDEIAVLEPGAGASRPSATTADVAPACRGELELTLMARVGDQVAAAPASVDVR
jgi:hypothetical protein